jgi:translation elongation factor EF-4
VVRQLRRRGHAGARDERHAEAADKILLMAPGASPVRAGRRVHAQVGARESSSAGEVGFIIAGIKEIDAAKVGDTVTHANRRRRRRCRASRK